MGSEMCIRDSRRIAHRYIILSSLILYLICCLPLGFLGDCGGVLAEGAANNDDGG